MFTQLVIKLDRDVVRKSGENDRILTVESIRDSIIEMNNNESEEVRKVVNFQENSFPKIIYSQPHENKIKIYSLGDTARVVLNAIFTNLMQSGGIKIKGKFYKVIGVPEISNEVDCLPYGDGSQFVYTTITPLCIFSRNSQKVFQSIAGKHFKEGHYFEKGTAKEMTAFKDELKIFVNQEIRNTLKYYLSSVIENMKNDDFEFVDNLEIEWEAFVVVFERYHTEEKKLPMIAGRFSSNFSLPRFLGYKVGKGFGEMSLKHKTGGISL